MRTVKQILLGKPKDPLDPKVFHQVSLIAFLAWVGLGADGLSSSAYGPEEAYPCEERDQRNLMKNLWIEWIFRFAEEDLFNGSH